VKLRSLASAKTVAGALCRGDFGGVDSFLYAFAVEIQRPVIWEICVASVRSKWVDYGGALGCCVVYLFNLSDHTGRTGGGGGGGDYVEARIRKCHDPPFNFSLQVASRYWIRILRWCWHHSVWWIFQIFFQKRSVSTALGPLFQIAHIVIIEPKS
jgi:hypothetical protein